ncbi:MAG TPA: TolC family protein [Gemmatimonadales bacterium]|nr:TolC family protein [Gemmatimonadales bacterium]
MSRQLGLAAFAAAVLLPIAPSSHAQAVEPPGPAPTLDQVVAIALQHNPDVVLARLNAESMRGEQRIARALPNPQLQSAPNQPWQYTITMPLDITPQRLLRTRAAARGSSAALDDAVDAEREVRFAARQAFLDVLLAERQRDLANERRDTFEQLLRADSARLVAGDIPPREVTKAELEEARAAADVARADGQVHAARLALQLIMGIASPDTGFRVAGELVYRAVDLPLDSLSQLATGRADVRAAAERVAQTKALDGLATASLFPLPVLTFSHSAQVFPRGDLFTFGTRNSIGVGFTFPLFYFNGGERQVARAAAAEARLDVQRLDARVANDVATALDAYRSTRMLSERYQSGLLARARDVLQTAQYAYRTGAVSLLELLDAIATYSDTRADYYAAVHDYWVAVYALARATGREWVL